MSRLESIKERLINYAAGKVVKSHDTMHLATQYALDYNKDVSYLLQRLEIAQKALDAIYNVESLCERDSLLYAITEINQIAEKALDQLKE